MKQFLITSLMTLLPTSKDPWTLRFLILLGAVFLLRLLYLLILPFDLAGDEAYYWDWGRRLDWGYFSKPPGIAWLMAGASAVFGPTEFGLKFTALLLGSASLVFVFLLGRRMFGARAGFWATLVMACTPGNAVLNLMLTIDAPLLFAWTGALWAAWRALEPNSSLAAVTAGRWLDRAAAWRRRFGWAALTAVFCMVGLLSKQMMLAFFGCALIYLLSGREERGWLLKPGPWLLVLVSLGAWLPPLVWNARNDWITFQHTAHHFNEEPFSILAILSRMGEFIATQAGLFSPLLFVILVALTTAGLLRFWRWPRGHRFLFCFGPLPLVAITLLAIRQDLIPNWAASFYPAATLLIGAWAAGNHNWPENALPRLRRLRGMRVPGVVTGFLLSLFLYAIPWLIEPLGVAGGRLDPTFRTRGWQTVGAEVGEVIAREFPDWTEKDNGELPLIVVVGHRYHTSALAFYVPGQPLVFRWEEPGKIASQYELWPNPLPRFSGRDGLIVLANTTHVPEDLASRFSSLEKLETIRIPLGNERARVYQLFRGQNMHKPASEDPLLEAEQSF